MSSDWFALTAKGHFGYAQPEDHLGHAPATYDLSNFCIRCGVGAEQNAPIRMKSAPTQERSHFLQLNWVFDEFFVRPEVKAVLEEEEITGISFLPPVIHRTGEPIPHLFQLRIESTLPPGLITDSLQTVTCREDNEEPYFPSAGVSVVPDDAPYCGRVKYHMPTEYLRFDAELFDDTHDVVKTHETFGSGASGHRQVLVSERFATLIREHGWRGVQMKPVVRL